MATKLLVVAALALLACSSGVGALSPNHRVFRTAANLGPETVPNWSGYIGTGTNHSSQLFYWFFESRGNAATDPIVLWMTGGPGCSGQLALFTENGPYHIMPDMSLTLNPHSWTEAASVIWIDQPVNSGFSYNDPWTAPGVVNEAGVSADMSDFLHTFFNDFSNYTAQPFHIIGESYAGHYVPAVSARLLDDNAGGVMPKVNIKGAAIGNGLVDPLLQFADYAQYSYDHHVVNNATYSLMKASVPTCQGMIEGCNTSNPLGVEACAAATEFCETTQLLPIQFTGINPYDSRKNCTVPPLCYNFSDVTAYLNLPHVMAALGTTGHAWSSCNRLVNMGFVLAGDWVQGYQQDVAKMLEAGNPVLVYSGEYDIICNWYGGRHWTHNMTWPGRSDFISAPNTTWTGPSGDMAGTAISAKGFTFLRVKDAGHMVPRDQPVNALDMVKRYLAGKPFDGPPQEDN